MITQHTVTTRRDEGGELVSKDESERKLYSIQELKALDERAYRKAYEKWAVGVLDYEWWDACYDSAVGAAESLGINIATRRGSKTQPAIFFSGFSSQGDGASWEGSYAYQPGSASAIRKSWPEDKELQRIADGLQELQRKNFYGFTTTVSKAYRGEHSGTMTVTTHHRDRGGSEDNEELTRLLRDFADWIYRMLEKESEYLTSEEQFVESAAGDLFDEDGVRR